MSNQKAVSKKEVYVRILQLKNSFYWNSGGTDGKALGKYCALGYFDALDITSAEKVEVTSFDTWKQLGELTINQGNTLNCRTLVCVTEQHEKDKEFWNDKTHVLYFITMVRLNKSMWVEDKCNEIVSGLPESKNHINYLSYDHSEIIAVTKTNTYSEGIKNVEQIRKNCNAVKTYTVFAVEENTLQSYDDIRKKLTEENVCCRLHCMVRDYAKAEDFRKKLEKRFSYRNERPIKIRKFETFGGYDWLLEIDSASISSVFECYKMGELLTHSNTSYKEAFFNVESEILIEEEQDGGELDRGAGERIGEDI